MHIYRDGGESFNQTLVKMGLEDIIHIFVFTPVD